jgi:Amt family ammonium transporter
MRSELSPTLRRCALAVPAVAAVVVLATALPAAAQDAATDATTELGYQLNLLWVVLGAVLVIFMQAGFALVETGFCRAKHAAHVVTTNFAIFGLGFVGFLFVGFPLAFGGFDTSTFFGPGGKAMDAHPLLGSGNWAFLWKGWDHLGNGATPALLGVFLYMVAFMDTVATIPTGAMAERWRWKSFVGWGLFCGAIYYPLFAAWTWGGGWLSKTWDTMGLGTGYVDFAGSGVVHSVGAAAGLAGAIVLGPRIGKYAKDGTPRALPGHHIPMALLGTFILLFGWFGFNAASTFAATDVQFATVATNTAIAGAVGAVVGLFWIQWRTGKPDPGMQANAMLAGLVAITAPCAFVAPWAAAVIGLLAAIITIEAVFLVERRWKIDDPVGAIAVHGFSGGFGVLAVGIFANGRYGAGWNGAVDGSGNPIKVQGLITGHVGQFGAQLLGLVVIWTVIFGIAYAFWKVQDKLIAGGIRADADDEIAGMDLPEIGVLAYPEFQVATMGTFGAGTGDSAGVPHPVERPAVRQP